MASVDLNHVFEMHKPRIAVYACRVTVAKLDDLARMIGPLQINMDFTKPGDLIEFTFHFKDTADITISEGHYLVQVPNKNPDAPVKYKVVHAVDFEKEYIKDGY